MQSFDTEKICIHLSTSLHFHSVSLTMVPRYQMFQGEEEHDGDGRIRGVKRVYFIPG